MKLRGYKRAFKFDLMTCFIGLIIFTVGIVVYSYNVNSENTLRLSNSLLTTTINHAVGETTHHLKIAEDATSLGSILLANKLDLVNDPHLEQHVIKILKQTPFLFMYYIADENGHFILGYRNKFGSISTKLIYNTAKNPHTVWKYRDAEEAILTVKSEKYAEFDPRLRGWYQGVKAASKLHWTEVYKFHNNEPDNIYQQVSDKQQLYGITVASPIINLNNEFKGVVGADISLNRLSDFFSSLKIGENGKALVVNQARKIILFSDLTMEKLTSGQEMTINDIEQDWVREGAQEFFKRLETEITYRWQGKNYLLKVYDFSAKTGQDWFLIIIIPEDDFLGRAKQARSMSLLIISLMLLLSVLFCVWLSRSLSKPIESITQTMEQVKNLNFTDLKLFSSPIQEFQQMSDATTSMTQGLKGFLKYVPPSLVQQFIEKGEAAVVAEHQELNLSFFFSDIEGFTSIAEEVGPKELMTDLSHYFDQMTHIIVLKNQGTIDKYIGDSVMAFWGAPNYISDHSRLACYSALGCRRAIDSLNEQRRVEGKKAFNTRIGIHTGLAIVGHLGSNDRINYTVIGDNVNLASRIEGVNKIYHTNIIVSQITYRQVYQYFVFRPLDFIIVKGKNEGIKIYELITEKEDADEETLALVAKATKAFDYYLAGKFEQALAVYHDILKDNPQDHPAKVMIAKCEQFMKSLPDENWTGATRIFEK
ncbi:MAG: adenylate/guanylate cyclase domain-containing protein [Methylococcales bacterium]|nr:adenylate/guanylate cyclase domain-containing protein [Methylococcales bacterium]